MGQEIVYCYKCLTRLVSSDFDRGQAFRVGDRFSCAACVQELLASLPEEEREAVLKGGRKPGSSATLPAMRSDSSSKIKRLPAPARPASTARLRPIPGPAGGAKKTNPAILAIAVAGVVVVAGVLVLLLVTGKGEPPPPKTPPPQAVAPPLKTDPAKKALDEAVAYATRNPADLSGRMQLALAAVGACANTPHLRAAEDLRAQILAAATAEFREIDRVASEFFGKDLARSALDHLDQFRTRYDFPEWTQPMAERRAYLLSMLTSRFDAGLAKAMMERKRGNEGAVKELADLVAKWALPDYAARLKNELVKLAAEAPPAETPAEKPPSKALLDYRERWKKAVGLAQARSFGPAIAELESARRETKAEEALREAEADLKAFRLAAGLHDEALKSAAQLPRWTRVSLEVLDGPGNVKKVEGAVLRADARRLEIRDGDEKTSFVELPAILSASLADLLLARRKELSETDGAAAGYLSILEGHDDAARRHFGDPAGAPPKYWEIAKSAPRGPRTDPKELEARRLFHAAELEWRSVKTRGPAIEKYRQLQSEFAVTRIGGEEAALITRRAATGKEYVLFPSDLRAGGHFRPAKYPPKVEGALTSQKDAAGDAESQANLVEAEFHALPDTAYRCWAYVGACCKETFLFYLMTTEGTTTDKGKEVSIDLATGRAAPIEPFLSSLAATHAKDKGGAKAPRLWTWVPVPLPRKYSAPGAKTIRLLSDHQGFSVACLVVSSTRRAAPTESEMKEMVKEASARPEAEATGTPEPTEWLLCGPFKSDGLNGAHPPESGLDPAREMPGKDGPVKWRRVAATMLPGRAARFDYRAIFGGHDNAIAYALIHVKAPAPMTVKALLGSDDGIKAWHNGAVFHTKDDSRAAKVDEDVATLNLMPGWNRLLFKVRNGNGEWGFIGRLATADGKPAEGLEYDPYGDLETAPR